MALSEEAWVYNLVSHFLLKDTKHFWVYADNLDLFNCLDNPILTARIPTDLEINYFHNVRLDKIEKAQFFLHPKIY